MSIADPHGRFSGWILSLSNLYFTVIYLQGLVNQFPHALTQFTPEDRDVGDVEDEIPTFEGNALALTRAWSRGRTLNSDVN